MEKKDLSFLLDNGREIKNVRTFFKDKNSLEVFIGQSWYKIKTEKVDFYQELIIELIRNN